MNRKSFKTKWISARLFSIIIIPISAPSDFLDLKYKSLPPNEVIVDKQLTIKVDNSASPVFYKFKNVSVHESIELEGEIKIINTLGSEEKDAYFQLGIVYEGSYKPGWLVKKILPEWLLKTLSLNDKYGVGNIDFFHITNSGYKIDRKDSIRAIKMVFKTVGEVSKKATFKLNEKLRHKKILGLWFRADADDSKGKFITTITKVIIK